MEEQQAFWMESYHLRLLPGVSLVVQWLRLHASNAGGMGSIPGQGTKIPHASRPKKKKLKKKKYLDGTTFLMVW